MNTIVINGRLTADVTVSATKTGEKMVSFNLAHNGRNDSTMFLHVVTFGREAEFAEKYLKKGAGIEISGDLSVSTNEKDGKTYTNINVYARSLGFYGFRKKDGEAKAE